LRHAQRGQLSGDGKIRHAARSHVPQRCAAKRRVARFSSLRNPGRRVARSRGSQSRNRRSFRIKGSRRLISKLDRRGKKCRFTNTSANPAKPVTSKSSCPATQNQNAQNAAARNKPFNSQSSPPTMAAAQAHRRTARAHPLVPVAPAAVLHAPAAATNRRRVIDPVCESGVILPVNGVHTFILLPGDSIFHNRWGNGSAPSGIWLFRLILLFDL